MRSPRFLAVLLLAPLLLLPVSVQGECIDYGEYVHWVRSFHAHATSTAVWGSVAAVPYDGATGGGVQLISVDPMNPSGPTLLSTLDLGFANTWGMDVAAAGGRVYLAASGYCQGGTIWVVDATDPHHPAARGSMYVPGDIWSLAAAGNYVYVGEGCIFDGMHVIDAANPDAPHTVGSLVTPGGVEDIAIAGAYAYLTVHDSIHYPYPSHFQVVDLAAPQNPVVRAELDLPLGGGSLALHGHYAYLGALQVIDIADPLHPQIVGTVTTIAGSKFAAGARLFIATPGMLQVLDLSDPLNPAPIASMTTPGFASDVAVAGPSICLAASDFHVYALGNGRSPDFLGSLDTPGQAYDVALVGNLAYVADESAGLQVVNVSDPALPERVGSAVLPAAAYALRVLPPFAYVATAAGLSVVDVTDPAVPFCAGSVAVPHGVSAIAVSGNCAFLAGDNGTAGFLTMVDIQDPSAPTVVGSLDTEGFARGLDVSGDCAYVGVRTPGWPYTYHLRVVRVADPSAPQLVASLEGPYATAIAIAGNHAYLNSRDLNVVDISDPGDPRLVATIDTPTGGATYPGLCVRGHFLYAPSDGSFDVYDIADPARPRLIGTGRGGNGGLAATEGLVCFAHTEVGLNRLVTAPAQCDPESGVGADRGLTPTSLLQAFPNPAPGRMEFRFTTARPGAVTARILDVGGRLVRVIRMGSLAEGTHTVAWDGRDAAGRPCAPGVYLVSLSAGGEDRTGRVLVVR